MIHIKKLNEMDDFTIEIAKDLFNKLPKVNFTEDDFKKYMKDKGSSDSITNDVLQNLKNLKFPFTQTQVPQNFNITEPVDIDTNYSSNISDWYFDVWVGNDGPTVVGLTMFPGSLDDQLGSHNLPEAIKVALDKCGVYSHVESMESIWEMQDGNENLSKEEIVSRLKSVGFVHDPDLFS